MITRVSLSATRQGEQAIIGFPFAFVLGARPVGRLPKEIENGGEKRVSTGYNVATIEDY